MRYYKPSKYKISYLYLGIFAFILSVLIYSFRGPIHRSAVTINLGSLYIDFLNQKAELINYFKNNELPIVAISMSNNNFVRLQTERALMVNNYVLTGTQWSGDNEYYKATFNDNSKLTKSKIKLFGMNSDHFRNPNSHSFRIKYDGSKGYGKRTANFLNPRSRDFITDPLLNIIYSKLYDGIEIDYKPYQLYFNKSDYGIYYEEDFFDKYLIEGNNRRESVIFEIVQDSLEFNHLGEDNSLESISKELALLYTNDYDKFLQKIDVNKTKSLIKLCLLVNSAHPLSDINLHWYYNPVTDLLEPTIREAWANSLQNKNFDDIHKLFLLSSENKVISDFLTDELSRDLLTELINELDKIEEIINSDNDYQELKKQMIGFSDKIKLREEIIKNNIAILKSKKEDYQLENDISLKEKIEIKKDTTIKGEFIISEGQELIIHNGVKLTLDNAYLKIYGGFKALGLKTNQIHINGINNSGTIFINTKEDIAISNTIFNNLTNTQSVYNQPASITFYECDSITIDNSQFSSNLNGDDYINFFRSTNILINDSTFSNVINDAIDADFSDIKISNSKFENIGNDAVDGSGSKIALLNNSFKNVMDKAISAGEKSIFELDGNRFINNEIGLVSKDESIIYSKNDIFKNNKIDVASFIKKKFFDYPKILFENAVIGRYLIEDGSKVIGLDSIQYSTNVEEKLYGNLYGRASD
tara:strand:- start:3522 stop:5621 length:2100 start_codon:yes stop_codon:yes gene_type:complete